MLGELLGRIADRLILFPTNHAIEVTDKTRRTVTAGEGRVEVWIQDAGPAERDVDVFVLKFGGTEGRAELATPQPACFWPSLRAQLWTVNPPGYGGSGGRASMRKLAPTACAVFEELQRLAAGRPVVLVANSLGGTCALHLAARYEVAGLVLRNPPQLNELIVGRFGWRSCYLGAWLIARQVPAELDCCSNAQRSTAPAVFVMSECDTIVPPRYQRTIHEAYAGPNKVIVLPDAEHADSMSPATTAEYQQALDWLWSRIATHRAA